MDGAVRVLVQSQAELTSTILSTLLLSRGRSVSSVSYTQKTKVRNLHGQDQLHLPYEHIT